MGLLAGNIRFESDIPSPELIQRTIETRVGLPCDLKPLVSHTGQIMLGSWEIRCRKVPACIELHINKQIVELEQGISLPTYFFEEVRESFVEFRMLFGLRFHLYALTMDRELLGAHGRSVSEYKSRQRILARKYVRASNMPPIFPILPYSLYPGYLPSNLMINAMDVAAPPMNPDSLVPDLIDFAPKLKGDRSEVHWRELLADYCRRFLKEGSY